MTLAPVFVSGLAGVSFMLDAIDHASCVLLLYLPEGHGTQNDSGLAGLSEEHVASLLI